MMIPYFFLSPFVFLIAPTAWHRALYYTAISLVPVWVFSLTSWGGAGLDRALVVGLKRGVLGSSTERREGVFQLPWNSTSIYRHRAMGRYTRFILRLDAHIHRVGPFSLLRSESDLA